MRKLIATCLSASLIASTLITGCGSTSSAGSASTASAAEATTKTQTQDTTDTPAAESTASTDTTNTEKTVIEYWHCNADTQGGTTVEELVSKFNAENDHIEVVAKYNPDMYKGLMQNLQAEATTGNTPAVVQIGWAFLEYFSNNFTYTTPQEAIDLYDPESATFLTDNFLPNVLDLAVNNNGEQVGIPYSVSNPVLYINEDLLTEAGVTDLDIDTWEEVKAASELVRDNTGKYGLYIQEPSDFWAQQAYMESNGAQLLTANGDGTFSATFASEEGIEALQTYADMVADGSALHITWEEGCQAFVDGNCAMLYTTIARRAYVQENCQFNVSTVKSPTWGDKERKIAAGGCFLAITAQEPEQIAAAWEFEKYLYSVESMAAWTIGTGYVPPRKDVADAENGLKSFLAENALMTPAIEQMDSVTKWTSFPGDAGLIAEQTLLDARDQILGGQSSAKDALESAQEQINALLSP
ncbi:MAG: ABC transporter substrate-binding protein [Lachnospiraceae bacterium]|nr:ABC transporter substrate-binding protein [Lachnospiraceae bacterium]